MSKKQITIGKYRALQRSSTLDSSFAILAVDHQDILRRALNPDSPMSISAEELTEFKLDVVGNTAHEYSAVLLDPVYSAGQAIAADLIHKTGLIVELEKADYEMAPLPRIVEIRHGWNVEKVKRMGSDGVKLFFYYNPEDSNLIAKQNRIIMQEIALCEMYDLPIYAQPVLVNARPEDRTKLTIQSAQQISHLGVDILKLEFPIDINTYPDQAMWRDACKELTESLDIPWILVSAGNNYDTFYTQLEIACKSGASGFNVGRAIWWEASHLANRAVRQEWLRTKGRQRMHSLTELARQFGTRWTNYYSANDISTDWYKHY